MSDAGGEGFELGAAFVSVTPETEDLQPQVEAAVEAIDVVVNVPVIPDVEDFKARVDAAVAETDATVQVPVVPDTAGFKEKVAEGIASGDDKVVVPVEPDAQGFAEKVDSEVSDTGAKVAVPVEPDAAGFAEKTEAEVADTGAKAVVPLEPGDLAGFEEKTKAESEAAGETSGASFGEKFANVAGNAPLFGDAESKLARDAEVAGDESASGFGDKFKSLLSGMPLLGASGLERDAEEAASGSASGFGDRFKSLLSGLPLFSGAAREVETEAGSTAESAGESFASKFGSRLKNIPMPWMSITKEAEEEGSNAGEGFLGKLKAIVSGDISPMEAAMGAGFVAATAIMASKFQSAMEQIHTQAGVGQGAIKGLSGDVLGLASKVGESPDSLAQALYHVESSFQSTGIKGKTAMDMVRTAAEGARIGGADLVDVQNALDAAIKSGIGGVHNYGQAMGALNAIVGTGDMKMQDLATAMGTGIMAVAKSYGQNIDQVGAALAVFGDNNIRGAKAATDLRMAMQAILDPVATAGDALKHLGLSSTQLGDEMEHHGLSAALQMFVQHLKDSKVPADEWGQYMTEIFGKKAGVGIGVLTDQLGNLQSKFPDLERASHGFGGAWAATQQTVGQKLHELEGSFEALMVKIGNGLLPILGQLFSGILAALPTIEHFGGEIAHLVAPFVTSFFTGLHGILSLLFGPMKDVTLAIGAMAIAWGVLNVAMAINPFVAIGIALVALVGVIIKYHKQIEDVILGVWHRIEDFFKSGLDLLAPVAHAFDAIKNFVTSSFDGWWASHGKEIEAVWDEIWGHLARAFDIAWGGIKQDASAGWNALVAIFHAAETVLSEAWNAIWAVIGTVVKAGWDVISAEVKVGMAAIEAVIKIAWDVITGIFSVALDLLTGHWGQAWTDIQNTVTQVWNAIKGFFQTVWDAITTLFGQEISLVESALTGAWDAITGAIKTAWNAISSWFSNWWSTVESNWNAAINLVESALSTAWDTITSAIKTAWNAISSWFGTWWSNLEDAWKIVFSWIETTLSKTWDDVKSDITKVWGDIKSFFGTWWSDIESNWGKAVAFIKKLLSQAWSDIHTDVTDVWGKIETFFKDVWTDLKKGFDDVVSGIKTAWGKLKDIFSAPVSFLVNTVYDKGIARLWNDVAAKIPGIPKMPIVSMAAGGKVTQGTGPKADDVLARVSKGETVVSAAHSQILAPAFAAVGVPGYAEGGLPSPGGIISKIGHGIGSAIGGIGKLIASVETGSVHALEDALKAVVKTSAKGALGQMMTGVPDTLITDMVKGVIHKIESIIPGGGGPVPGGGHSYAAEKQIEQWWMGAGGPGGNTAHIAAAITGAESSFNVKAVQQGQPYSTTGWGLWQITPGNSEPQAGVDDQLLTGPTNAIAAVAKYHGAGNSFSPWTTYEDGAYEAFMDQGGWLMPGKTLVTNHTGQPERVLSPAESSAAGGVTINFSGTQMPTPEQMSALMLRLTQAVNLA